LAKLAKTNRRRSWQRKIKLSKEDKRGLKQKGKQKKKQITKEKSTSKGHKSKGKKDKKKGKTRKVTSRERRTKGTSRINKALPLPSNNPGHAKLAPDHIN